jgi:N utilization substance protein A
MKSEFVLAFNEVLEEKQLPREVVVEALEAAMVSAYRRAVNASNAQHVEAKIDLDTGKVVISAEKEIVDIVQDPRTEVSLAEAKRVDVDAALGGMVVVETTPRNFGRVAAQTARQVIQQRIREAERDSQLGHFGKQVGEIISGTIQAINAQGITLGLDMKAEGIMPRNQQVQGERFRVHDRIRAMLLEVKPSNKGPQIVLSRAHRNFLRRLLENEVPEIYNGMVEIRSIAREPGQRSKVAVVALQPGVDPVGACVGLRGVRIQAIVRELNDEKIDVIEWNPDPTAYIAKALSPARVTGVYLNEQAKGTKTATVVVPEDQLSLAIGRDGQNARLAAKLTSWRIDIKSLPEAAVDALQKLKFEVEFATLAAQESEVLPQVEAILAKKSEGRPVTPEEYHLLSQFVDRVERGLIRQREKDKRISDERIRTSQVEIPEAAYDIPVEEMGISLRYASILGGAGYTTVGDLMFQLQLDANAVLGLEGIGAKAMTEIETAIERLGFVKTEELEQEQPVQVEVTPEPSVEELPLPAIVVTEQVEPEAEPVLVEIAPTVTEKLPVTEEQPEQIEVTQPIGDVIEAEVLTPVTEVEGQAEAEIERDEAVAEREEMEELFTWKAGILDISGSIDDEESDEYDEDIKDKKKKKKKRRYVEMEFDPDANVVITRKKRKRGVGDWGDDWTA